MTRGCYGDVVPLVFPDQPCRATVIILDDRQTIRLEQDGRLIGYFTSVAELPASVDLATLEIR